MEKKYLKKVLSRLSIVILVAGMMTLVMFTGGCTQQEDSAPEYGGKAKETATGYGQPAKEAAAGYGQPAKEAAAGYGEKVPGYGGKK